ncbi:MAG: hypothetical protein WKG00_03270 [Polyangiaceae bacterium]
MLTIDIGAAVAAIQDGWQEAQRELAGGLEAAVDRAVTEGAAEARSTHRYQNRSHDLTDSIQATPPRGGGRAGDVEGEIRADAGHASFVDAGTSPHVIKARNAQQPGKNGKARKPMLRFRIGGQWVSKEQVNHPGTAPDAFMGRAYQKAERVLEAELEVAAVRAVERFGR